MTNSNTNIGIEEKDRKTKLDKYSISEQLSDIQEKTNLSSIKIGDILFRYRDIILRDLYEGISFRFGYIATIKTSVDNSESNVVEPLARTARRISDSTNIPFYSVFGVLKAYIELAEVNLRKGKSFNIVGILKLKPVVLDDGTVGNITVDISRSVNSSSCKLPHRVRAGVLSNFRYLVSNA